MPTPIIVTNRLVLRSALPQDFEPLFSNVFSDEQVMLHLAGKPFGRKDAQALFDEAFDHQGTGRKIGVLVERSGDAVVGYAGLKPFHALGEEDLELGFVLKSAAWGKGYATEIGYGQLEYGFRTTDKPRLLAQVRPANSGSANALRKIGMTFIKEYERPGMGVWQIYAYQRDAKPFIELTSPDKPGQAGHVKR
ncbi:MAG: GNAT family N-acetyltransferase [Pseudomonadota bacterium]